MNFVFSDDPIPTEIVKSIFLAGPSPRSDQQLDWRHEAVELLEKFGYDGTVFIPATRDKFTGNGMPDEWHYDNQIVWEVKARNVADILVFWVPRDIAGGYPAFTTNVEFGEDLHSNKMIYGRPDNADKCRYLDARVVEIGEKVYDNLYDLMLEAQGRVTKGALRVGGEVSVPLFIWHTDQFQSWYQSHKALGNVIHDAKVLSSTRFASNGFVFSFTLWVDIYVKAEDRHKTNEFVFARKDISCILAYYKSEMLWDMNSDPVRHTYIALVKEFRTPVNNGSGYVHELPGGSSVKQNIDPLVNAQHELEEEIGLRVEDISRFKYVSTKQLYSTLCSHKAHLYAIELNTEEYLQICNSKDKTFGVAADTEITYVEMVDLDDILTYDVDFSMLGMILGYFHK